MGRGVWGAGEETQDRGEGTVLGSCPGRAKRPRRGHRDLGGKGRAGQGRGVREAWKVWGGNWGEWGGHDTLSGVRWGW